jgi:lipopolysaccharide transport system ATP-binding protein
MQITHQEAVRVDGVSKLYEIFRLPRHRLWQLLTFGKKRFCTDFWALSDISLQIRRGETFGIVGRNGAGKSTLLQLICGILTPTHGAIKVNGRVTALLELGAGLNTDFTGLENIRMMAAVLGIPADDVDRRIPAIVDFAQLGDFMQRPVKLYSSGMIMRLAFSTAISFDPDILVVDEAMAVGDELFQSKCMRRIDEMKSNGATILFVSHSMGTITQICDRAALIDAGRLLEVGSAKSVAAHYTKLLYGGPAASRSGPNLVAAQRTAAASESAAISVPPSVSPSVPSSAPTDVPRLTILRHNPIPMSNEAPGHIFEAGVDGYDYRNLTIESGETVCFRMRVRFNRDVQDVIMGMMLTTSTGVDCYHTNLLCRQTPIDTCNAGEIYDVSFEYPLRLAAGSYIAVFDCQHGLRTDMKLVDIFYEALHLTVPPKRPVEDGGIAALGATIHYETTTYVN